MLVAAYMTDRAKSGTRRSPVGHAQDLRDIGVDVRVAVGALGLDRRRAELGSLPGDMGVAEQPQMLVSDRELPAVTDHGEQAASVVVYRPAVPPAQARAVLAAVPVERLDLAQVMTDHPRLVHDHSIVAAGRDRLLHVSRPA